MHLNEVIKITEQQIARISDIATAHGGGVEIADASEERLVLALKGHCADCPLSPLTYGVVLNKYIKEALPQIKEIKYIIAS